MKSAYIIVPDNEIKLFKEEFLKFKKEKNLKSSPIFMTEQLILKQCGNNIYDKAQSLSGWKVQQIVKMCFANLEIAKNYMTIDSDSYFTKRFFIDILFEKGLAKTITPNKIKHNNKEAFRKRYPILFKYFTEIKIVIDDKTEDYNNFVSGHAIWSSALLKKLEAYVKQHYDYNFVDLINIAPYEMQWYGNFVYNNNKDSFFPITEIFTLIDSKALKKNKIRCYPTDGNILNYGISFQHSTIEKYNNPCSKIKTFIKSTLRKLKNFILSGG